ncbi:MAG: DUF4845 domain-containing protein [Gammaproteobacteria bacterium]|nr:DUF4845 domain-containing protein [Gammaproteobacteria bacterium]
MPTWLAIIAIFSFLLSTFFAVFPMYYQNYQVQAVLTSIQEDASIDVKSKRAIWTALQKRLSINEVRNVQREHVKMSREDGKTTVTISYETRDNLISNLFIGGVFNESVVIDR